MKHKEFWAKSYLPIFLFIFLLPGWALTYPDPFLLPIHFFLFAIPALSLLAVVIVKVKRIYKIGIILLLEIFFIINATQTKNPLIYPIISPEAYIVNYSPWLNDVLYIHPEQGVKYKNIEIKWQKTCCDMFSGVGFELTASFPLKPDSNIPVEKNYFSLNPLAGHFNTEKEGVGFYVSKPFVYFWFSYLHELTTISIFISFFILLFTLYKLKNNIFANK